MAFTDFEATNWSVADPITALLINELEKRAMGARATCKVYRSSDPGTQTGGAPYIVDWEAENWDNDTMWTAGGDSDLVTIQQSGVYLINATVATTGNASGNNTYLSIELGSSAATLGSGEVLGFYVGEQGTAAPIQVFNQVSAVANLSTADEITLKVVADTNFDIDVEVYGDNGDGCWMSLVMIGRTPTLS